MFGLAVGVARAGEMALSIGAAAFWQSTIQIDQTLVTGAVAEIANR
jgi:hypothetical protein